MAIIPKQHEKYNLLRNSANNSTRECFSYPNLSIFEKIGIHGLDPYGFSSVTEYNEMLSERIKNTADEKLIKLYTMLKEKMIRRNCKENWSVLRYKGPDIGGVFGLRSGHCYYWPCDVDHPAYEGVIDDEEYTSYWYPTEPEMWEILEDPTGMAYETIYGGKNFMSKKEWDHVIEQFKKMENENAGD